MMERIANQGSVSGRLRRGSGIRHVLTPVFLSLLVVSTASAGPILTPAGQDPTLRETVHRAEHHLERAWEAFHQAALGGTLVSPAVQVEIEHDLHTARTLLPEARDAAERNEAGIVQRLTERIDELAAHAIAASQEQKP